MRYFGNIILVKQGQPCLGSVNEVIRTIDTMQEEMQYVKEKFPNTYKLINIETRVNILGLIKTLAAMKCYYGINYYGLRDNKINKSHTNVDCPRCSAMESWEYVVMYPKTIALRINFILQLHRELKKIQVEIIDNEELWLMINDIRKYLWGKDEFEINQFGIGMKYLF